MNINFFDPGDVPKPRAEIKIEQFDAQPYPDGWRVKINLEVTPFQERPNLEIRLKLGERLVAEMSVVETMHRHMEFTMHVRGVPSPVGQYVAEADLYYEDRAHPQDTRRFVFSVA
jgi:hypothetical protein